MSLMLGNLSVKQIEERLGIEFPDEIKEFMNGSHQADASNIVNGKWHCFGIPFHLVCGDMETATKIYESVKYKGFIVKEPLKISIQN